MLYVLQLISFWGIDFRLPDSLYWTFSLEDSPTPLLWPRYWHGDSSWSYLGQIRRSRSYVKVRRSQQENFLFFQLKVRVKLWENQFRRHGGKADMDWKLKVSNTSRKVVGATSSEGFFATLYLLLSSVLGSAGTKTGPKMFVGL